MSLLSTYTSANRQVLTDLAVVYTKERISGSWEFHPSSTSTTTYKSVWQYTRRATKHYRYTGMDQTTAQSCAAAMIALYTRQTYYSDTATPSQQYRSEFGEIDGGTVPMAQVTCEHVDGEMWQVDISVDELDTRLRVASVSPATLFTTENDRSYDTTT